MKYLIFVLLFCFSCARTEKPFIIIDKEAIQHSDKLLNYRYEEKNGNSIWFTDSIGKYDIGDTIK